jgi:hypothetical protein
MTARCSLRGGGAVDGKHDWAGDALRSVLREQGANIDARDDHGLTL